MTKILRTASLGEIESSLVEFGGGNHSDNMKALGEFTAYYLVELSEAEFFALVFLQNDHVLPICPRSENRSLYSVAERALKVDSPILHANWDLAEVAKRTKEHLSSGAPFRPLILRDTRQSELRFGEYYIQDGCHTALGYAMALLSSKVTYSSRPAYLATNRKAS